MRERERERERERFPSNRFHSFTMYSPSKNLTRKEMWVFSTQLDAMLENHEDTKWTRYSISMSKTQFWKKGSLGARVILQVVTHITPSLHL